MAEQTTPTRKIRFVNDSVQEFQQVNCKSLLECENVPLTSLEEAVETITKFYPTVTDDANRAKEFCRKNTVLTINESAAIYLYTMGNSFYSALNQALRAENPQALGPWSAYLKLLITALRKLPSCSTTVWRGVRDDIGSDFNQNTTHTWGSINSCSHNVKVASIYVGSSGALFNIHTINGKNITKFSAIQDEGWSCPYAWNSFASSVHIIRSEWFPHYSPKRMVSQHVIA